VAGVRIGPQVLTGELNLPPRPIGIVVSADTHDGPGMAERQAALVTAMAHKGLATLLFNPLTPAELQERQGVLDMPRLSSRIAQALAWLADRPELNKLPIGLLGVTRGPAWPCTPQPVCRGGVFALVTHGGRPDLAGARLRQVQAPTLLMLGSGTWACSSSGVTPHATCQVPGRSRSSRVPPRPKASCSATLRRPWPAAGLRSTCRTCRWPELCTTPPQI